MILNSHFYSPAENVHNGWKKATIKMDPNGTNILYCTIILFAKTDHQNNLKKETNENGATVIFAFFSASTKKLLTRNEVVKVSIWIRNKI